MSGVSRAYVGLGSNRGDRLAYLRGAAAELSKRAGKVSAVSSIYETQPAAPGGEIVDQPLFLNAAVQVDTTLTPRAFFESLKAIERRLGRRPSERWGPREIDLDLLLFGSVCVESADLTIPHPRMLERRFVLAPLAEMAPDARHPRLQGSASDWLSALGPPPLKPILDASKLF